MKITKENFPPELRGPTHFIVEPYATQHILVRLAEFFASEAWHQCNDKPQVLELFLQNAAMRHNPEVLRFLFAHGACMDIKNRAAYPDQFEGYYRIDSQFDQHPFRSNDQGNIFHLILRLPRKCSWSNETCMHSFFLCQLCCGAVSKMSETDPDKRITCTEQRGIKTSSLLSFKCMVAQALHEEVQKQSYAACMNTLALCMARKNAEHNNVFCKDVRNIIRRYVRSMLLKHAPINAQIIKKGCMNILPALKEMLYYKAGCHKVMPYQIVEYSWRSRKSFQDYKISEYLSTFTKYPIEPACEDKLWSLLDPKNVYATVEHIAREAYPEFDIQIDDPNSWGAWKFVRRLCSFAGGME